MRSANLFGPLKGLCPHKALIGLTQASGLAGGFDFSFKVAGRTDPTSEPSIEILFPEIEVLKPALSEICQSLNTLFLSATFPL